MSKPIKQTVIFNASPATIFECLTNSKRHATFTGDQAVMSAKVGAKVSAFSGWANGKNIEIVPNQKIVQTWSASIPFWPEKHESVLTITLKSKGKNKTELILFHENVPSMFRQTIAQGWKEYYWNPLKEYLRN